MISGTASSFVAAYKQTMLHAGLPIQKWVGRMFRYCSDGAKVMQPSGDGVATLLMKPQAKVLGYSVVVLVPLGEFGVPGRHGFHPRGTIYILGAIYSPSRNTSTATIQDPSRNNGNHPLHIEK